MVRLFSGDELCLEAIHFELLGDKLRYQRDGQFLPLAVWTPKHGGWIVEPKSDLGLPKGLRYLKLRGLKEPLCLGFQRDDGSEPCGYDGGTLELRAGERGSLNVWSDGATISRHHQEGGLWQIFDLRFEPVPRLLVSEWGTPPLYASFAPTVRLRPSGLAAR
jgi:hypothetical protein